MFEFKTTAIYQIIKLEKLIFSRFLKILKYFFLIIFIVLLLISILSFFINILSITQLKLAIGLTFISLALFLLLGGVFLFLSELEKPELEKSLSEALTFKKKYNLASYLDFETAKIVEKSFKKKNSNFLLSNILKLKPVKFILGRAGINDKEFKEELKKITNKESADLKKIIEKAAEVSRKRGGERIKGGDVLTSLAENNKYFNKILVNFNITAEDIFNLNDWYERIEEKVSRLKKFWHRENLTRKGSIGRDWAFGYTNILDSYSIDLTKIAKKGKLKEIIGHEKEIKSIERILSKEQINNVLIVGEPGSGRKSIIERLSQRTFLGKSPSVLNYKRILEFNLNHLIAQSNSLEEAGKILDKCFRQAIEAGNIILVIRNVERFMSSESGAMDISGILSNYLHLSSFQIIAITSYQGLHKVLERKTSLLNLFEKVEVREISEKQTLRILENVLPFFEKKHNKFITYGALKEIINLSSHYLKNQPFPEKSFRLLDEAISWLNNKKIKVLKPKHIRKIVSEKIEIPLEELGKKEKEVLLNLEELIHQRIINQKEAVKYISSAIRRARAQIQRKESGTIGNFLFLGPTGVGKTETSKSIASIYFSSKNRMIRIDMSEFQSVKDIKRLIGGENYQGILTTKVRENPFSLVLLDEIEKAHPKILNLFLQILDEGWVTDGYGRKVSFKDTMIIATSNAGAELIRREIKENNTIVVKEKLLEHLFQNKIFRPEFINRFDAVIVFEPLSKENLFDISQIMLKKLQRDLKDKGIDFIITPEVKEKIVELSYSPQFGARKMKRVIQNEIENLFAKELLNGKLKRGAKVEIKIKENKFNLNIQYE